VKRPVLFLTLDIGGWGGDLRTEDSIQIINPAQTTSLPVIHCHRLNIDCAANPITCSVLADGSHVETRIIYQLGRQLSLLLKTDPLTRNILLELGQLP
jgi:hypothetical protein